VQSATTGLNAAKNQDTVVQHRPRGNEDHQQWSLRADGSAYRLENTDDPGRCLARADGLAAVVACGSADAGWQIAQAGPSAYTLKDPGADRYLTVPGGDNYADRLQVGGGGDLARWYLTPTAIAKSPMPPADDRTLDQVTFLTTHNAYANGVDGGFAPPFVNFFPNQNRGINQQLADGVRGFMLDIYQTKDGAILCHQSCFLVGRPVALSVDLRRIVDFLNQNPGEFVTVFLEDYVAPDVLRNELAKVPGLANVLYRPDREGVRANGWPRMSDLKQRWTATTSAMPGPRSTSSTPTRTAADHRGGRAGRVPIRGAWPALLLSEGGPVCCSGGARRGAGRLLVPRPGFTDLVEEAEEPVELGGGRLVVLPGATAGLGRGAVRADLATRQRL
jgi:hypothetical protein